VSANEPQAAGREPVSYTIAGLLAAGSLAASAVALVYTPGRIGPGAILIALLAAAMGGPHRRLAAFAVGVATLCWFFGMIIAVLLERDVF
jgi:hypothetical protein